MTYLKGLTTFGDSTITNHIRENLIAFLDYGLLEKAAFINVTTTSTGVYNGDEGTLRPVNDPNYSNGQVWQAARMNWVWESGVGALTSTDAANPGVSGVYVDSSFYPVTTSGDYAHYINHQLGRVVFDSPISLSSTVECDYSYKYVQVTQSDGLPWFKTIHKKSERSDSTNFINNSGDWNILGQNRVQLPAIGIEFTNSRKMTPYQLSGGQNVFTDFLIHCIAEDVYTRDALVDLICLQREALITGFDLNDIDSNDAFPIDYRGVPVSGALTYPNLVATYPGTKIRILNIGLDSIYSLSSDIHVGTVKITTECILFGV